LLTLKVKASANFAEAFCYLHLTILPIKLNIAKNTMFTATIVAPTGVEQTMEITSPIAEALTEMAAEAMTTCLKFLNTRIAEIAGKIISAAIRSEPTRRIASTITTAVTVAISRL
jgi:hypothetical protein